MSESIERTDSSRRRVEYVDGKPFDLTIPPGRKGSQWGAYNAARRRGGRPKGSQNALTVDMQQAVRNAFVRAGGEEYLLKLSDKHPELFVRLLVRLIPATVEAQVTHNFESLVQQISNGRRALQALEPIKPMRRDQVARIEREIIEHAVAAEEQRLHAEETTDDERRPEE